MVSLSHQLQEYNMRHPKGWQVEESASMLLNSDAYPNLTRYKQDGRDIS